MTPVSTLGPYTRERTDRRIEVHLPVQVRGTDRDGITFEETTRCENVSRSGVAFALTHRLEPGDTVEITIPLPRPSRADETRFATSARVVHVVPDQARHHLIIGVAFTGPHFNRLFRREL